MKLLNVLYFTCTVKGREHIPKNGSFILASNHISNLDPFILGICCWRRFAYLAKEELFTKGFPGWFFPRVGAFPIKRDSADSGALKEAIRRLKNGRPLILFPEGTRGVGERQKQIQPGVGFIVAKTGVPVIPAYIKGSDQALPDGSKWFKRKHIEIVLGKPIHFDPTQDYSQVASSIMAQVESLKTA